jgi:hypothetical protein
MAPTRVQCPEVFTPHEPEVPDRESMTRCSPAFQAEPLDNPWFPKVSGPLPLMERCSRQEQRKESDGG